MDIFKLIGSIFIKNDEADKNIDTTESKAKNMASGIGSAMEKAGKSITNVGKALTPISVATGAMLTGSVKGASDFYDGMSKMSTLFDTTQVSVEDLSKEFLQLSNDTGKSATELTEAGYQALSASVPIEKLGSFVRTAGNLARAGFTSTTTSVDILTTAMNAYGDKAGSAEEIANKLVRTQNLGKTTVDELASSMGKIIPTASAMNVGINNVTSGYVSLTKQGIATAEATTYMNSMLNELGDSGTDLGGILIDQTGKSFQTLMDEGYSLADVLQITKDYADENGIAYNELWGSMEAGKAGLAILNGGVAEFNSTVEVMKSDVDDVGSALDKLETPSMKVNESINRVKNSGIELGTTIITALLPTLNQVVGIIESATTWFSSLDEQTKTNIATALAIVTALAPVLIIGGKLISGIGSLIGVLGNLWTVMMANPIMLIVALIGVLVGAFVYLWNNNESFRQFWINLWNTIKTTVQNAVNTVTNFFQNLWSNITRIFGNIRNTVVNIWNTVTSTITRGIENARNTVVNVLNAIQNTFSKVFNTARGIVTGAINAIKGAFNFSWSLPHLKLPHLTISGGFSILPPSVPHFGIDWYAKSMDEPTLFTKPTLFDVNPLTGTAKGAGEAGDELMYGHRNLMTDIREAVRSENHSGEVLDLLTSMFDFMRIWFPQIANMKMVTDTGALVGELAPALDDEFGEIIRRKERL